MKIHVGMMCANEASDLFRNVELLLPYVETINVVDGGSIDLTIPTMRNWQSIEPKIRFAIRQWKDNFPEQRNSYLKLISEIAQDGDWVLTCDPDEFFSVEALQSLRKLAEIVPKKKERFNAVGFQCESISKVYNTIIHRSIDQFWKPLFFKWSKNLRYTHNGEGPVHETLKGIGPVYCIGHHPEFPPNLLLYRHEKQRNITHPKGARNLWIGGGGMNAGSKNPRWIKLRKISDNLGLKTWKEFYSYLIAGSIDKSLKEWMYKYRFVNQIDGDSEHREMFKTYFQMLHPEELPPEMVGEQIP